MLYTHTHIYIYICIYIYIYIRVCVSSSLSLLRSWIMSEFLGGNPHKMLHHHHHLTGERLTCGEAGMQLLDLPDEDARKATKDHLGPILQKQTLTSHARLQEMSMREGCASRVGVGSVWVTCFSHCVQLHVRREIYHSLAARNLP